MKRLQRPTLILALAGFLLRLLLIFPGPLESKIEFFTNKADLRNYYWPAQAALQGENPYTLWASGQSGEYRADMAPLELAVYVATVAVWNDPRAIQVLFALFDALNVILLGLVLKSSPLKLPFQVFYAFGPLTVYNLVLVPEDKTIVLALTFLLFYLLSLPQAQGFPLGSLRITRSSAAIVVAALLGAFKWLSVFYLVPLLLFLSPTVRELLKNALIFALVIILAHLPWIPSWMYVYTFRSARTATPIHVAPAVLLSAAGIFDPRILLAVLGASLLAIYVLFWFGRIDIFETIALSMGAGILWTPDMDPVHLSLIVIAFLLIVNWTRVKRQVVIWGLGAFVAAVYALSTRTGFTRYGLPDPRIVTGDYGSLQMIVLSYALFAAVLAFYLIDKSRNRPVGGAALAGGRAQ